MEYQSIEQYDKSLKAFKVQFGNIFGVIKITGDDWDGSSFIVLAHFNTVSKSQFPESFEGFRVEVIDPYIQFESLKGTYENLLNTYPDLKSDDSQLSWLKNQISFYEKIINEDE